MPNSTFNFVFKEVSVQEYVDAIKKLEKTDSLDESKWWKCFLAELYYSVEPLTCQEIADGCRYKSFETVNLKLGEFAAKIANELGQKQELFSAVALIDKGQDDNWVLVLRRNMRRALAQFPIEEWKKITL